MGATGAAGSNGSNGAQGNTVVHAQFITATQPSYQLAGGVRYTPLLTAGGDTAEWSCVAPMTGTCEVVVKYSMSASNAGDVELTLDRRLTADGSDLNATVTAGADFTVTPGSNTNQQSVDSGDHSSLSFSVAKGQNVYIMLTRTADAEDTHTGDFRIHGITMEFAP
jgi:hypothetical protein